MARSSRVDPRARAAGKFVSLFEPSTEVIRKGKAGKPFGMPGRASSLIESSAQRCYGLILK
jgi:hypothetical protein